MKLTHEVYGLEKAAMLPMVRAIAGKLISPFTAQGVKKGMGGLAKGFADKNVSIAKRFGKAFSEASGMEKAMIGLGGLSILQMVPGYRQVTQGALDIVPGGGVIKTFTDPFSMVGGHGHSFKDARRDVAAANYQRRFNPNSLTPQEGINKLSHLTQNGGRMIFTKEELAGAVALKRTLEKNASAPQAGRSFGKKALLYTLAGVGMGAGAPLAMYGVGKGLKKVHGLSMDRDYKKVVKEDPSLKSKDAKKLYGILHKTSPHVAKHPMVAAKVLRNMMEVPQITPQTFADVQKLEKLYQDTDMPFFSQRAAPAMIPSGVGEIG